MQVFFAGAESPSHLKLLRACGVHRVGVNVNNLARFTKHYGSWATKDRLGGLDWIVYADSPICPVEPVLELLSTTAVQPEVVAGPVEWAEKTWIKDSDLGFLPIWDGHDQSILRTLIEDYDGVVLPDAVCDNAMAVRTARAALPTMGTLGGLTGRTKGIERFDVLISSAWWAVQKHGETQVWTGNRMVRMNSEDKHLKRQRYTDAIEALGCNVGAVLADDPTETVRCAVLSWTALERHVNLLGAKALVPAVASHPSFAGQTNVIPFNGVASGPIVMRQQTPVSPLANLPIMTTNGALVTAQDGQGNAAAEVQETIEVTAASARQCSTCQLSAACPAFSPGSACSYQIPVVIKTKDQRVAVMRALVEIQTQRILMGSFSEQVLGTPDASVGREMDRLFNMVEKWKNIEDNSPRLKIDIEGRGDAANMGLISRLFGEQAGQNARALERPMLVDEIIEESEMSDD